VMMMLILFMEGVCPSAGQPASYAWGDRASAVARVAAL
jgi:hypothetical protein